MSGGLRQGVNKLGNVSLPTAFYTGREQTLAEMVQRSPFQLQKQFNPERTELLLDDNYATRMICGDKVYEQEAPIGARELECARSRLQHDFSFVGVLERNGESMCALAHLMGVHPDFEFSSKKVSKHALPHDFELAHGRKYVVDKLLYASAHRQLDATLARYPACPRQHIGSETGQAATALA